MDVKRLRKKDSVMIKGLAIMAVITSHMSYIANIPTQIEKVLHPMGYLGVSLFLAVSGYGCAASMMKKSEKWQTFFVKRCLKIIPLLALVTIVSVALEFFLYGNRYNVIEVLLNAIGVSSSIGKFTWYICCQFFWYIVFSFSIRCENKKIIYLVGVGVVYVLSSFSVGNDIVHLDMWGLNCLSFPIGVWFAMNENNISERIRKNNTKESFQWQILLFVIFMSLFALCYIVFNNPSNLWVQNLLKSLISASFVIAIIFGFIVYGEKIETKMCGGVLLYIGGISYELYLIHGYWIFTLGSFFVPKSVFKIFIYIMGTLILSVIVHKILIKVSTRCQAVRPAKGE